VEEWEQQLIQGCQRLGIQLFEEQIRSLRIYRDHLLLWNPRAGLISTGDEPQVLSRHFLDSLSLLWILDLLSGATVLDVGSGGGFPGIPLKICRPEICITLFEPQEKRYYFLKSLVRKLGLNGVSLHRCRAQEAWHDPAMRARFDLVVARAVTGVGNLVGMCFPFLRRGGLFVSYRGKRMAREEVRASQEVSRYGGEFLGVVRVEVPGIAGHRHLLLAYKL
jgi:16S rRNA (guanine527-N7)-methyltransferase